MNQWPVWKVRGGDEECFLPQFIQPKVPAVLQVLEDCRHPDIEQHILNCYDWVCRNIEYPITWDGRPTDYHLIKAFPYLRGLCGVRYLVTRTAEEYFQYPGETLTEPRFGDCEDTANALTSMLRNVLSADEVFSVIGRYHGGPHAWVALRRGGREHVLETTLISAPADPWNLSQDGYEPAVYYNDLVYDEIQPVPALTGRNGMAKLRRIAAQHRHPTKGVATRW